MCHKCCFTRSRWGKNYCYHLLPLNKFIIVSGNFNINKKIFKINFNIETINFINNGKIDIIAGKNNINKIAISKTIKTILILLNKFFNHSIKVVIGSKLEPPLPTFTIGSSEPVVLLSTTPKLYVTPSVSKYNLSKETLEILVFSKSI